MFIEEEIKIDKRPRMAVFAPGREFVLKYFDRAFDRRITGDPAEADEKDAFLITGDEENETEAMRRYVDETRSRGINVTILRVPFVIGTGMDGTMLRLARRVSRGSQMQIKGDETLWSVIHATDIANVALEIQKSGKKDVRYTISAPPIKVNDLVDALSHRIKNKRIGTISPRWAKLWYGKELYSLLTTQNTVDTTEFNSDYPDFVFVNPAEYLKTHNYDDDSL